MKAYLTSLISFAKDPKAKKGGFTLLETIIAILILGIAIGSLFELVATGLFSVRYAKNEMVATYLGQEALDFVRNDRDSAMFGGGADFVTWLDRYRASGCFDPNGCYLDVQAMTATGIPSVRNAIMPCASRCPGLQYRDVPATDLVGSYYGYSQFNPGGQWRPSGYGRSVKMETLPAGNPDPQEVLVSVTVTWPTGTATRTRTTTTSLFKWPQL